jgi:hypothetical protein
MRKVFKIISYILIFIIFLLGALFITINKLETQAISKIAKNIIEYKLSTSIYKVTIGEFVIKKQDKDFYSLKLSKLQIYKKQDNEINKIGSTKDIDITLNTSQLYRLKYVPVDISVDRLNFEFSKDPNEIEEVTESVLDNLVSIIKSQLFWVGNIKLSKSKLGFVIGDRTRFLDISSANMALNKEQKKINLRLTYELRNQSKHSHDLDLDLSLVKNRYLNISANLSSLPAHLPMSQLSMNRLQNLQHAANEILISGSIFHSYDSRKRAHTSIINLNEFTGKLHSIQNEGKILNIKPSKCYIEILEDYDMFRVNNCSLNFGNDSSLNLEVLFNKKHNIPKSLEISGYLNNLPVGIIDYITDPSEPSDTKEFLDEFIEKGNISKGKWRIKLDKKFFNKKSFATSEINGNFHINDTIFKYEGGHPKITNLQADVTLEGTVAKFSNINGKVERSNISDSKVTFDWLKWDDEGIEVDCKVKGPVGDFIKYIEKPQIASLKAKGVDLATLEGIADTSVKVHVPLKKEQKILVKVASFSSDFGMKFLNDTIHLKNTTIKGSFDEAKLAVNGNGFINGAKANISFEHNFDNKVEFEDLLKADIYLSSKLEPNEYFSINKGEANLKVDYKSKNDNGFWNIESDLKNAELVVDKIGIVKPLGRDGFIKYSSSSTYNHTEPALFEFKAANGIDIVVKVSSKGDSTKVIIDKFNYGDTRLKAELNFSSDHKNYKIYGSSFDLSAADIGKLFSTGKRTTSSNYDIKIDKVILKNGIDVKDLKLSLKCSKEKCHAGYMNSYFGDNRRFFDMLLKDKKDHEEWTITTNNAGALFRGFGVYPNLRSGTMIMRLYHSNKLDNKDNIKTASTHGTVSIKRFATVKTPFMTKLVSIISLPGFINTITRRNYILFRKFNGKFSFDDGVLNIDEGAAEGFYFDFNIRGSVDTNKRSYHLKGQVVPALYGISYIVKKIPIIGQAFSGGRRKGLFGAPFVLKDNY